MPEYDLDLAMETLQTGAWLLRQKKPGSFVLWYDVIADRKPVPDEKIRWYFETIVEHYLKQNDYHMAGKWALEGKLFDKAIEIFSISNPKVAYFLTKLKFGTEEGRLRKIYAKLTDPTNPVYETTDSRKVIIKILLDLGERELLSRIYSEAIENHWWDYAKSIAIALDDSEKIYNLLNFSAQGSVECIRLAKKKNEKDLLNNLYQKIKQDPTWPKICLSEYYNLPIDPRRDESNKKFVLANLAAYVGDLEYSKSLYQECAKQSLEKGYYMSAAEHYKSGGFFKEAIHNRLIGIAQIQDQDKKKRETISTAFIARRCGNFKLAIELLDTVDARLTEKMRKKQEWLQAKKTRHR